MKKSFTTFSALLMISLTVGLSLQSFSQSRGIKAVNDTIDLIPGIPLAFDILENDTIPENDTVLLITLVNVKQVICQMAHDSTWKWTFIFMVPNWGYNGLLTVNYRILTKPFDTSTAQLTYRIQDNSYDYLDINNVRARFNSSGPHFFYDGAEFEVPKGSGKKSLFSNSIWIGGIDTQSQLHFAGERFGQGPTYASSLTKHDFFGGPVMDSTKYSVTQDTAWNYIWKLKKSEIEYHRAHYWENGYQPIHDILTWPGNGDVSLGQAPRLAPFCDRNQDGHYDPFDGDYPEIRGDQALFFIFNDDRNFHTESEGVKLRVEIHGMAYAFDMPNDSALKNTVFLNYRIFNRSQQTYSNTYLGVFSDIDLGWASDDFIGCDVMNNMFFGYNGTPVDGTGQPQAYGANPPVQSVTIMAGPCMDPDGLDNPKKDNLGNPLCDFSVNGLNFGDTVVDNERFGMQRFIYFVNSGAGVPAYMLDPNYAPEYYSYMNGLWKDGSPVMYGGNGHFSVGGYGPACRFMFPGLSDPLNWGVGCVPPNGPVDWTEVIAGNAPADRRGLAVTGPFTFNPGDMQELDIAFTWARDYNGTPMQSVEKLRMLTSEINEAFAENQLPNGEPFYGVPDYDAGTDLSIQIYPNPASRILYINFGREAAQGKAVVELMSVQGNMLKRFETSVSRDPVGIDISTIPAGIYIIKTEAGGSPVMKKAVILH